MNDTIFFPIGLDMLLVALVISGCTTPAPSAGDTPTNSEMPPLMTNSEAPSSTGPLALSNAPRECRKSSIIGGRPSFYESVIETGTGSAHRPTGFAVGFINDDGYRDLVTSSSATIGPGTGPTMVAVHFGQENGAFSEPGDAFQMGIGDDPISVVDINGDGRHDIAARGVFCITEPSGRCGGPKLVPTGIGGGRLWGHVDDDLVPDVVTIGTTEIYAQLGPVASTTDIVEEEHDVPRRLRWNIMGDVDGDGANDIIGLAVSPQDTDTGDWTPGSLNVFLGDNTGHFMRDRSWTVDLPDRTTHFAGGDFNCDGLLDVALAVSDPDIQQVDTTNNKVRVLLSNKHGFSDVLDIKQEAPMWLAVGDVNGDGHHDLVVENHRHSDGMQSGTATVLIGDGTGLFNEKSIDLISVHTTNSTFVAVGDLEGDGIDEIFTGERVHSNAASIWRATQK
ncbi:MAG: VCBS repeat-containing protein [Dehalococcoidales bacterium]